jgi:hypothetical protein
MCWNFKQKPLTDADIPVKAIGFIYLITNKTNNKKYIGRKLLQKSKTTVKAGIKKKSKVESDWKEYWSSSPVLLEAIESEGKENFTREILFFVESKGMLLAMEEKALYMAGALEHDEYYNQNIRSKIYRSWIYNKVTDDMNITLRRLLPDIHPTQ